MTRMREILLTGSAIAMLWALAPAAVLAQDAPPPPAPLPLPDAAVEAAADAPAIELETTAEAAVDEGPQPVILGDGEPAIPPKRYISLMFPQQRVDDLMLIFDAYMEKLANQKADTPQVATETGTDVDDIIRILQGEGNEEINPEIFNFNLNSILYDAPDRWSIWINGRRYNRKDTIDPLEGKPKPIVVGRSAVEITNVSQYSLTFRWLVLDLSEAMVMQRWKARQANKDIENDPLLAQNAKVQLNEEEGYFYVTLRPNQTFSSQYMTVMEGKNAVVRNVASPAATPEAAAEGAEAAVVPAQPEGSQSFEFQEEPRRAAPPMGEPIGSGGSIFDAMPDDAAFQMRETPGH